MHLLLSNNSRTRQYYYSCIIKLDFAECTDIRSPCWLPVKFWLIYHHTIGFSLKNYVISISHWLISWFILWLRYCFLVKSIIIQTGIEAERGIVSKNVFIASILYLKMVSLSNLCRPSNSYYLRNNHPSNNKQSHG